MPLQKAKKPSPLIALVAERLLRLRQEHKLTPAEAAERIGIGLDAYRGLESGKRKQISTLSVEQISKAFGIEAYELLGPMFRIGNSQK